ncbi:MAG: hypothetical protein K6U87_10365 [Firmicutes bacterium]|nr:hypothetical protein [Bacillota bacterium]
MWVTLANSPLGQSAFYGFGAYVADWTTLHLVPNGWLGLLVGTVASGLLANLLGWPVLRLRGHYLALSFLALAIKATVLFTELSGLTGGVQGMSWIRPLGFVGQPLSLRATVLLV